MRIGQRLKRTEAEEDRGWRGQRLKRMVQELKKMLWLEKYRAENWTEAWGCRENRGWARDMGETGRGIGQRRGE